MNLLVPVQEVFRALSTMKVPWSLPGSAWYWPALMAFSSFLRFFSSLSSHNSGRMGGKLQLPDLEWPSVDYHGWPPFSPKYSTPPNETMVKSRGISTSLGPSYGGCSVWRGMGLSYVSPFQNMKKRHRKAIKPPLPTWLVAWLSSKFSYLHIGVRTRQKPLKHLVNTIK